MKNVEIPQTITLETLPDILNVHQVREVLGIGRKGVYNLLDSRKISYFKIGNAYKIPKSALIDFINQSCEKAGE